MKIVVTGVLALTLAFSCAVAQAQTQVSITAPVSGHTYYNRPGSTLDQHQHDVEFCFEQALMAPPRGGGLDFLSPLTTNNDYYLQTYGAGATIGATLILGLAQAGMEHAAQERAARTNYDNCMVVLGWRVVQVDSATGGRLSRLDRGALTSQLAAMVSAESPEGTVARTFGNEAINPAAAFVPSHGTMAPSLSLRGVPGDSLAADFRSGIGAGSAAGLRAHHVELEQARDHDRLVAAERQRLQSQAPGGGIPLSPMTREELAALSSDAALVVVRVTGGSGMSLTFDGATSGGGKHFEAFVVASPSDRIGEYVIHVSPGRWRITSVSTNNADVSFCLGSPSFEVGPGEAVFAGTFNLSSPSLAPDLSIPASTNTPETPAPQPAPSPGAATAHGETKAPTATLAASPELTARMRPASYSNGSTSQCNTAPFLYALEFPGLSFLEGYHWGSQANVVSAAQPATPQPSPQDAAITVAPTQPH